MRLHKIGKIFIITCGFICILAILMSRSHFQYWWIRIFDFPYLQILCLSIFSISVYSFFYYSRKVFDKLFVATLITCIGYQLFRIYPYTIFSPHQSLTSERTSEVKNHLNLVICNVLMTNRDDASCLEVLKAADADVILTVETDKWWEEKLIGLEKSHPYTMKAAMGNTYGMLLYSKFKIINPEIKYILDPEIPSFHCLLELKTGAQVMFHGVHPKPPAPQESKTSINRDAELIIVGKEAKKSKYPQIICGDLNDVAWSHTTHQFQRVSGLLDPRIGRGMFPTYNAKYVFMRWPLDHVFHSSEFKVLEIKRLPHINSDHFPMLISLSYEPDEKHANPNIPKMNHGDKKEVKEKIENTKNQ